MPGEKNDVSPIDAANSLTPWWMTRIKEFDAIEIKSCEIIGHTLLGNKIAQPCEPEHADLWAVYGHYKGSEMWNSVEDFEDFKTKAEAEKFRDRLLDTYPHLKRGRPALAQEAKPKPLML